MQRALWDANIFLARVWLISWDIGQLFNRQLVREMLLEFRSLPENNKQHDWLTQTHSQSLRYVHQMNKYPIHLYSNIQTIERCLQQRRTKQINSVFICLVSHLLIGTGREYLIFPPKRFLFFPFNSFHIIASLAFNYKQYSFHYCYHCLS